MGMSWTIVFVVLATGFLIIPGAVFLSHLYQNRKNKKNK